MKEVLELKHLAPYLPYGLKIIWEDSGEINGINFDGEIDFQNSTYPLSTLVFTFRYPENMGWKPILRPLSDLTKEIEHNGEKFVPKDKINQYPQIGGDGLLYLLVDGFHWSCDPLTWDYNTTQWLFSLHFDVFGLIEKGLAVDFNSVANIKMEAKR